MNINNLKILFVKDYNKEKFDDTNNYLSYYPIKDDHEKYPLTNFIKKDPVSHIKVRNKSLWLYDNNDKLIFEKLQGHSNNFTRYVAPLVVFLKYIGPNLFFVYKHIGFGIQEVCYLIYHEFNKKIYAKWTVDPLKASIFKYNDIKWSDLINRPKLFEIL